MTALLRLLPVALFFVLLLAMGFYVRRTSSDARAKNYSKE